MWRHVRRRLVGLGALAAAACSSAEVPDDDQFHFSPDPIAVEVDSSARVEVADADLATLWTSDDESIATIAPASSVSYLGFVTGISPGTTTVRVMSRDGQRRGSAKVTVLPHLELSPAETDLGIGQTVQLTVANADGATITWSSPGTVPTLAVSATGLVTVLRPGQGTILATDGFRNAFAGVTGYCDLNNKNQFLYQEDELTFFYLPESAPPPETLDTSFYAVNGQERQLKIYFQDGAGGRGPEYFSLTFSGAYGEGVRALPDGTRIAIGDSALVRVRIPDPRKVRFEISPKLFVGEDGWTTVRINAAGVDFPAPLAVDAPAYDYCVVGTFSLWRGEPGGEWARNQFYWRLDPATDVITGGMESGRLVPVGPAYRAPALPSP
jgi:hypothetical protein